MTFLAVLEEFLSMAYAPLQGHEMRTEGNSGLLQCLLSGFFESLLQKKRQISLLRLQRRFALIWGSATRSRRLEALMVRFFGFFFFAYIMDSAPLALIWRALPTAAREKGCRIDLCLLEILHSFSWLNSGA